MRDYVCITYNTHGVTLHWGASSTPNVTYNVYRGAASAGPFSKITNVSGLDVFRQRDSSGPDVLLRPNRCRCERK